MKTILFISKDDEELWNSFKYYDYVVGEYSAAGFYAVCEWNQEGLSVSAAVPTLSKLVGVDEDWRAIIVCDLRDKNLPPDKDAHFDNPYDFPESYDVKRDAAFKESENAFVRLTQMLGGFPSKANVKWSDWLEGTIELVETASEQTPSGQPTNHTLSDVEITLPQNPEIYDLLERYRLGIARPQEIICITPREVDIDLFHQRQVDFSEFEQSLEEEKEALVELAHEIEHHKDYHLTQGELEQKKRDYNNRQNAVEEVLAYDNFWHRNSYPSCARFVVCDRRARALECAQEGDAYPETNRSQGFLSDYCEQVIPTPDTVKEVKEVKEPDAWFEFWLCVLTLIIEDFSSDYLHPFQVHRMSSNLDMEEFSEVLSIRKSQWHAVHDLIEAEIADEIVRLTPSEYKMAKLPDYVTNIDVSFDLVDENKLYANQSEMGFFRDEPRSDFSIWIGQKTRIIEEFRRLLRAPARAVSLAVSRFKTLNHFSVEELDSCVMNAYQREELEDSLREIEYVLGRDTSPMLFEVDAYQGIINEGGKHILSTSQKRTSRKQALYATGVACVALLVGFLPYCFAVGGGIFASASVWLITLTSCLILCAVSLLTLIAMRTDVHEAYDQFKSQMRSLLLGLHAEAQRIGRRISSYATFMKGWSLLERQKTRGSYTSRSVHIGKQDTLLRTRMEDLEKMSSEISKNADAYDAIIKGGWRQAERLLDAPSFFSICDISECKGILNQGLPLQKEISVPYSFVSDVCLEQIDVS